MMGSIILVIAYSILYMNFGFEDTAFIALMVIMINTIEAKEKAKVGVRK